MIEAQDPFNSMNLHDREVYCVSRRQALPAQHNLFRRVASVPMTIPNEDEDAPGLSLLETGDGGRRSSGQITNELLAGI